MCAARFLHLSAPLAVSHSCLIAGFGHIAWGQALSLSPSTTSGECVMWNRRLGILLVALSLGGAATLPASAQNPADDRNGVTTRTADDGFDLGWLGLIGLVGLL